MKNTLLLLTFFCLPFFAVSAQERDCHCNLAGTFQAKTIPYPYIDDYGFCASGYWEGTIIWEQEEDEIYRTFTVLSDTIYEDAGMGFYAHCIGEHASPPGGDLMLKNYCDSIQYIGTSQWGEEYTITNQIVQDSLLILDWENSYSEFARTELVRTDGTHWFSTPCISVASQQIASLENVDIFPNPVLKNQAIQVQFYQKTQENFTINVYDLRGTLHQQMYHKGSIGEQSLHLSTLELSAGTYFLEIKNQKNKITKRIIIQ